MNTPLTLSRLGHNLPDLRARNILTDITLNVSQGQVSRSFSAHRIVLAASSDYFNGLLFGSLAVPDINEIDIETTDPSVFEKVLDFMYGQTVNFSSWIEKMNTLILLRFFLIEGIDFEKEVCRVDVSPVDVINYILLVNVFYPTLPSYVAYCIEGIGGKIKTNAQLQSLSEEIQDQLAPQGNTDAELVKSRMRQRAAAQLNDPIKYYRLDGEWDEESRFSIFARILFIARSEEEVLLLFEDEAEGITETPVVFESIAGYIDVTDRGSPLNRFDIEDIDKVVDEIIAEWQTMGWIIVELDTIQDA